MTNVHSKMMEYEDLRSYMLKIHDLVLKLQETIKDREYDIKKLKEEVENQKTTIYKKNEEIIKLKADV
jgi:septal ring factor EnvC (AmiA/AmiB activator)